MGSGGDANEDLYGMLGWGDRAVVIIYCETASSVAIPSFVLRIGLSLGLSILTCALTFTATPIETPSNTHALPRCKIIRILQTRPTATT